MLNTRIPLRADKSVDFTDVLRSLEPLVSQEKHMRIRPASAEIIINNINRESSLTPKAEGSNQ